ncbi:43kDa postsynaptic protein [Trema orientale]|uniref:RING-type E3 ubiquitin transferase n=1 Tax=Trema orientale TaxID=63057 RepID=A0A2P5FSR2_TREOI|nr:43kDa postsynaptic protein [Trema orientale]
MVLNKLLSMICYFISLKGQPRIKETPASCKVIEVNVKQKAEEGLAESATDSITGEGEFCCVCLSRLEEGEETSVLPCLHEFHKECIERWFSARTKTCPICRFSMEEEKCYYAGEFFTEEMLIYFSSFHAAGF